MNNEDIVKIKRFIELRNKGLYVHGGVLTEVYNRVLNKNARPTNCSSCCRQRVAELETALNAYLKAQEASNDVEQTTIPTEENNASEQPQNKPKGRPKKN